MIPETFEEWQYCIQHDCGIALTSEFITARLTILRKSQHEETQRFVRHYGEVHRQRIIHWFEHALNDTQSVRTTSSIS
ncbi:hypothetical protein ABO04_05680 [Nitrosomonas sp. HPC101]|nr:hypothetical protein [Nitrosomonas sp. HPC101]